MMIFNRVYLDFVCFNKSIKLEINKIEHLALNIIRKTFSFSNCIFLLNYIKQKTTCLCYNICYSPIYCFLIEGKLKIDLKKSFIYAIKQNNELAVKTLLSKNVNINVDDFGEVVCCAAELGFESIVKLLLSGNRSISIKYLVEAIKISAEHNHQPIIEYFLINNLKDRIDYSGEVFYFAAEKGYQLVIKNILLNKIFILPANLVESINIANRNRHPLLVEFIFSSLKKVSLDYLVEVIYYANGRYKYIIDKISLIFYFNKPCFSAELAYIGFQKGYKSIIEFVISRNLICYPDYLVDLIYYSESRKYDFIIDIIDQKLKKIEKINFDKSVIYAVNHGYEFVVLFLLKTKKVISPCNLVIAVCSATKNNYKKLIEYLLISSDLVIEEKEFNEAVENKDYLALVKFFLLKKSFINESDLLNLFVDAAKNNYEAVFLFILSILKNIPESDLMKSFKEANLNGHKNIIKIILSKLIPIQIPFSIKEDVLKLEEALVSKDGTWTGLMDKLTSYVWNNQTIDETQAIIDLKILRIARKNLVQELPFIGTPKLDKDSSLKHWYICIKDMMAKIDSKIDPDPIKDTAEKKIIINDAFALCGGAWQSHLNQIKQKLIDFPNGMSVEFFIGKIISDTTDMIVGLLNKWYAEKKFKHPNVHDQNKIRFYLRDFIIENVLDDHLSNLNMEDVLFKFSKEFDLKLVINEILSFIEVNSIFKSKVHHYYKNDLFKGCSMTCEIELKIKVDFLELKIELENLEEIQSIFQSMQIVMNPLSIDEQIKLFYLLQSANLILFKALVVQKLKNLGDEQINDLFKQKENFLKLTNFLHKVKSLNNASFKDILTKDKDQLMQFFLDKKQDRIEFYALEDFEIEHVKDGEILSSGIKIILDKIGFLSKNFGNK